MQLGRGPARIGNPDHKMWGWAVANEIRLYGPDGRPVRKRSLTREAGRPTLTGVRQLTRHESMATGLTPRRLASILRTAAEGDYQHDDYLTLAEEMEERDPHYAAVLGVRKRAVSGLDPAVESATDDSADVQLADAVRDLVRRPEFASLIEDSLDALGKGFSAVEIIWDRSGPQWMPARYEWRDPRFFVFDRVDASTLRLLDEADSYQGIDLEPYKWVIHKPHLKSGIPIRGGLARLAAIPYMVKSFTITDWTAFAEVFGMPLRLGRYGENASEDDILKLISAVGNLGTDAAAVIPESMRIEFTEVGNRQGAAELYERLAVYLDKQVSKAVLGQTMTADDGASKSQAQVHDEVRGDILRSDARQLESTLNRDLVRPFIDLNHGVQERYPQLLLPVNEPENIKVLAEVLGTLVPLGLQVEASVIRDKLGLPDPEDGAELLGPADPLSALLTGANRRRAANRARNQVEADALDELIDSGAGDWEPQLGPLAAEIRALAERADSYEEFLRALPALLAELDTGELTERLASAMFQARGLGAAGG